MQLCPARPAPECGPAGAAAGLPPCGLCRPSWTAGRTRRGPPHRALCAVANLNLAPALLLNYVDKATKLRDARAFLHKYERAGLEDADLAAAIESLCEVVDDYDARFGYLPSPDRANDDAAPPID